MPSPDQIRATVAAYVEAYNTDDRDALIACFAPDGVLVDPVGTPEHRGTAALGAFWDQVHTLSPTIRLHPERVIVAGEEAVMVFTIDAAGMRLPVVDAFEFAADGRIQRCRAFWDLTDGVPG